ncbi:MAG: 3-hydroxyacyl-CoA dehydrogenase family protein [Myxococcota bacterium]|nr:3-hydroxyacyl-CoA dehydrogenase family protein [Myxococcota bacterium]
MNVKRIAVIGAGTMGNGIAGQAALKGFSVDLFDVDTSGIERAHAMISKTYAKAVARNKSTAEEVAAAQERLRSTTDITAALTDADLIIEAVPEQMPLKQDLFLTFENNAPAHAVLASNTSSLSITEIASVVSDPARVVGMHFFNPVAVMPLVELVSGEYTASATLQTARSVAETMGKECIEVVDSPGFATSRLGIALGNEAMRMFEEGVASAADIDKAMVLGYRHPIGPLALTDLVGLDVRLAISEHLFNEIGTDTFRPPRILRKMVRAGKLGRKTGRGFYEYE